MLDLYTWPTPNGHKVHIMLEELGVAYNVIPIDIWAGEQFSPDFLRISPNNKMPALVDHDGPDGAPISIFESGAILLYLAEKHRRLLPDHPRGRWEVMQWLMFQMSGVGPFLGQAHHFRGYAAREDRVCDRPLHERGEPALPRARRAPRGSRVPRGRVLHRGHCDVPVAAPRTNARDRRSPTSPTWSDGSAPSTAAPPSSAACRCSPIGVAPDP